MVLIIVKGWQEARQRHSNKVSSLIRGWMEKLRQCRTQLYLKARCTNTNTKKGAGDGWWWEGGGGRKRFEKKKKKKWGWKKSLNFLRRNVLKPLHGRRFHISYVTKQRGSIHGTRNMAALGCVILVGCDYWGYTLPSYTTVNKIIINNFTWKSSKKNRNDTLTFLINISRNKWLFIIIY